MSRDPFWRVEREWPGETAFIVAGGPSVLEQDLELLRGRHVIVINSSVAAVPWADFLYFGDWRWWHEPENKAAIAGFAGRAITVSQMVSDKKVRTCRKTNPPGLARAPDSLMQKWTSLTAATNLAAHLVGPGGTIVWLGADGKHAADGRTHHHKPHRWPAKPGCYDKQRADLMTIVPSLRALKISLFNASPGTAWADLASVISLQDILSERRAA
jgi:hypothetical protein